MSYWVLYVHDFLEFRGLYYKGSLTFSDLTQGGQEKSAAVYFIMTCAPYFSLEECTMIISEYVEYKYTERGIIFWDKNPEFLRLSWEI